VTLQHVSYNIHFNITYKKVERYVIESRNAVRLMFLVIVKQQISYDEKFRTKVRVMKKMGGCLKLGSKKIADAIAAKQCFF
jgi:hypothetical protein